MKSYEEIIDILKASQNPVPGKTLAEKLNVTDRTIRNYIKKINSEGRLIVASQDGYSLVTGGVPMGKELNAAYDFSYQDDRIIFIINRIMASTDMVNTYDLADEMYVSYSTIEKDILKVKETIEKYNLTIRRSKGFLTLTGAENDKRKLIKDIIYNSSKIPLEDYLDQLCAEVNIDMRKIKSIITDTLAKHKIYTNDYYLVNILIHVIITIYRLKKDLVISSSSFNDFTGYEAETNCCLEIVDKLSREYNIFFNDNERNQLTFLLVSKTSAIDVSALTLENADDFIERKYLDFTYEIIKKINYYYFIDLTDNDFILLFSLHLKNLIFRTRNNYSNNDILSEYAMHCNPLIYEIGVFIGEEIKDKFDCRINSDELSFIIIHVGAVINRKQQLSQIIKAALVFPNYYNYENTVKFNLNHEFSSDMEVLNVYNVFEQVPIEDYDLIINASPIGIRSSNINSVNISPLISDSDITLIRKKIDEIKASRKKQILKKHFESFFDERLFERNHYFNSPEEMIRYMAKRFVDFRLADSSFIDSVMEREQMSPTSFDNNVAIPHSIKASTVRNCTYVIINGVPMHWSMYDVQIVILIGINENQRDSFKKIYSYLLEALNDPNIINKLCKSTSYTDFISILTSDEYVNKLI